MKKVMKIVGIIILIGLVLFLINLGRKVYIISEYNKKVEELNKEDNYYMKYNDSYGRAEQYKKGDISYIKRTNDTDTVIIYSGKDADWGISDIKDKEGNIVKTAGKFGKGEMGMNTFQSSCISMSDIENPFVLILVAFKSNITTEILDNKECYKISFDNDTIQVYFEKESGLKIREVHTYSNQDTGIIEYRIDDITDEEMKFPSLEGYNITTSD